MVARLSLSAHHNSINEINLNYLCGSRSRPACVGECVRVFVCVRWGVGRKVPLETVIYSRGEGYVRWENRLCESNCGVRECRRNVYEALRV